MQLKKLFLCLFVSFFILSCSDQGLQPTQSNTDDLSPLDPSLTKAKSNGGSQSTAPGLLGEIRIDENGLAECVMSTDPMDPDGSAYNISAQSGKSGTPTTSHKQGNGTANIIVSYSGFTPEAQAAFQSAVDIWASSLDSEVDIKVNALFVPLGPGVLGAAGSTFIINNFEGARRNTWYGNALGDKLAGEDLVPGEADIIAFFSSAFPNWYFGTDGNTPQGDFDFRTVVLHELGHGLNFFGGMTYNTATGLGSYGFGITPALPTIYDQFTSTRPGRQLVKTNKFPNPSVKLGDALIGDQILFGGPRTKSQTKGDRATLYTPDAWRQGSSYSHLDEVIYTGTIDGLMTPFLAPGESFSNPGPIVFSMFDDMGWNGKIKKPFKLAKGN